jgi:hypothetical protein
MNRSGLILSNAIDSKEGIMSFKEFIELITKEQPSLEDITDIMTFAESADVEVIWEALQTSGIHVIIVSLLTNVLQQRIQAAREQLGMPSNTDQNFSMPVLTGNATGL